MKPSPLALRVKAAFQAAVKAVVSINLERGNPVVGEVDGHWVEVAPDKKPTGKQHED